MDNQAAADIDFLDFIDLDGGSDPFRDLNSSNGAGLGLFNDSMDTPDQLESSRVTNTSSAAPTPALSTSTAGRSKMNAEMAAAGFDVNGHQSFGVATSSSNDSSDEGEPSPADGAQLTGDPSKAGASNALKEASKGDEQALLGLDGGADKDPSIPLAIPFALLATTLAATTFISLYRPETHFTLSLFPIFGFVSISGHLSATRFAGEPLYTWLADLRANVFYAAVVIVKIQSSILERLRSKDGPRQKTPKRSCQRKLTRAG
jgi:hypothetical protein